MGADSIFDKEYLVVAFVNTAESLHKAHSHGRDPDSDTESPNAMVRDLSEEF